MSFAFCPIYSGDYLRDTRHLTPSRHGVYFLFLLYCWDQKGPLPLDEQECAGIANCRSVDEIDAMRYVLGKFFVRMEDGHYNPRMQKEIERASSISNARSAAGRAGYQAKAKHLPSNWQSNAKQVPLHSPPPPQSSPQPPQPPDPQAGEPPEPPRPTGASAGVASQPAPEPKKRVPRVPKDPPKSNEVWSSYSTAYRERYGVEPVRNAKVNGQMSQVVQRLGADEAPGVARFYVSHRNSLYVNAKHCTDLLLRDCEKLRTEWATGQVTYQRDASESDRLASVGGMWERISKQINEKDRAQ